jgi:hypothetical protein
MTNGNWRLIGETAIFGTSAPARRALTNTA